MKYWPAIHLGHLLQWSGRGICFRSDSSQHSVHMVQSFGTGSCCLSDLEQHLLSGFLLGLNRRSHSVCLQQWVSGQSSAPEPSKSHNSLKSLSSEATALKMKSSPITVFKTVFFMALVGSDLHSKEIVSCSNHTDIKNFVRGKKNSCMEPGFITTFSLKYHCLSSSELESTNLGNQITWNLKPWRRKRMCFWVSGRLLKSTACYNEWLMVVKIYYQATLHHFIHFGLSFIFANII